jgi:ketosteroid isomerase-like protein
MPTFIAVGFRGEQIVQLEFFYNRVDALKAVGWEESTVSQKNVELAGRVVAALNARDLEGYLACCSEDVELHLPVVAGVYEGPQGIKRWFAEIEDFGPDFHIDLRGVKAIGGNQVLAFQHVASTGRASGIPATMETAVMYDLIDGKIRRIRIFLDRDEALKAVGLEE